mgnify:CR=1 FL=1
MLDVLLINPNYVNKLYGENTVSLCPPLGLCYLASYIKSKGISVEILEANALGLNENETVEKIMGFKTKIIGITAVTSTANIAFQLCEKIKEKDPSKIIIFGGVHISFLIEDSLRECPSIDYAVIGEGEKILYNLIKGIKNRENIQKIEGIAFIDKKGKFIQTPRGDLIKNLDEIPFPARKLLPLQLYRPGVEFDLGFKGKEYAEIITSRGCPNKCTFCSSTYFWKMIRMRSVGNIIDEIKELKEEGVKHITFVDDTISLSKNFILELCKKIAPLNLKWDCYARVSSLDEEIIESMKKSGCFAIRIGFESGSDEILKKIKKNTTTAQGRKVMKYLKKHDMRTLGFFMIGFPDDTIKTINETINFSIELDPTFAAFAITTPFPGTEMFEYYLKKGWLPKKMNWEKMSTHDSELTITETLNPKEILTYYKKAKKKFYLRPEHWAKIFFYLIRHPKNLITYAFRLSRKFGLGN